jgi:hypothetical protein
VRTGRGGVDAGGAVECSFGLAFPLSTVAGGTERSAWVRVQSSTPPLSTGKVARDIYVARRPALGSYFPVSLTLEDDPETGYARVSEVTVDGVPADVPVVPATEVDGETYRCVLGEPLTLTLAITAAGPSEIRFDDLVALPRGVNR